MSAYLPELKKLINDLTELNLKWALIGGLAYSVYADPRTTKDIDIALLVSEREELEEIISKLLTLGYKKKELLMHANPTKLLGIRVSIPTSRGYSVPVEFSNRQFRD